MEELNAIFEIAKMIANEKTGSLSESESGILKNWLSENDGNKQVYYKLKDGEILIDDLNELKKFDAKKAFQRIEQQISIEKKPQKPVRLSLNILKYAAAFAAIMLCSYLVINKIKKPETTQYAQNTFMPGKQRAILITANNQEITLDSLGKKQIVTDEMVEIVQSGSTLSYHRNDSVEIKKNCTEYNTLVTPRSGEYTLVLSDGTEVMLNSESKLKYPVIFSDNSREVELEGEAFFKVTKSTKIPFVVKANDLNVTVYGTVFNVSAYSSETLVQTTLVEGSVGVSINNKTTESDIKLIPGQQLTYYKSNGNSETKEVNTEQFIAWTKGMFVFENEPIENILKVLSRWYDFDIEFKDDNIKNQRFTISLGRYDQVSKILDMISISSDVKFSTKGNSILVNSE
jgi:transmembrane sensor